MPAQLRTFVLQTVVLDRLCGPLCDAVLGITSAAARTDGSERGDRWTSPDTGYSQLVLAELDQSQLFLVQLDDERRWHHYHHLFAELLQARLRVGASAEHLHLLHQRAAAWYEAQGE